MSVIETVLIFVVIPLVLYGVISALTLRTKFGTAPRYRPGQEWDYPPQWWTANPEGLGDGHRGHAKDESAGEDPRDTATTVAGGARGSW